MRKDYLELQDKKPCSHCGKCCLAVTCALGQAIFLISEDAVCPAIEVDENKLYYCGLVSNTANYVSALVGIGQWKVDLMHDVLVKLIGIGVGCTNGEKTGQEHKMDKTLIDLVKETVEEKILNDPPTVRRDKGER